MGENNCRASCIVIHPCCREDNASSERERAVSLLASSFGGDPDSGAAGAKIDLSSSGIVISVPVVWLGWPCPSRLHHSLLLHGTMWGCAAGARKET